MWAVCVVCVGVRLFVWFSLFVLFVLFGLLFTSNFGDFSTKSNLCSFFFYSFLPSSSNCISFFPPLAREKRIKRQEEDRPFCLGDGALLEHQFLL